MTEHFPKNEKLKSKKHFDQLFSGGKSVKAFPVRLIYIPLEKNVEFHKTGVSAPKRKFKKAVDRNLLKRLMREAFRKNKYLIDNSSQKYALLFIYTGKTVESYDKIASSVEKIMHSFVKQEKLNLE